VNIANNAVKRLAAAGLSALLAIAGATTAQAGDLTQVPAVGAPKDFALPSRETVRLPNGLTISFVPFGSVPKVTLSAVVRTGNIDDGAQPGLVDITTSLMAEGAGSRAGPELDRYVAGMGGSLGVGATANQLSVALDVLSERAADAIGVIADVLRRPQLPAGELERLRGDLARQVALSRAEAQSQSDEAFAKLLWGDHPYGSTLPSDADIAGYRLEDIRRFVDTQLGAARTHIYVAGRYDRTQVEAALRAAFGDWTSGPAPTPIPVPKLQPARVKLVDRKDAPQSTISLGLPVITPTDPDWVALQLTNSLLGGAFFSRITLNIRESKGYAYSPGSGVTAYLGAAQWAEEADVTREDTAAALKEIYGEIERLAATPPPQDELVRNQNLLVGRLALSLSSRQGLLGRLAFLDLHGLPDSWLAGYVSAVRAVTPQSMVAVMQKHLDPRRMTLVVVGDMAKVRSSIRALPQVKALPEA
jgi:zinc protease